MDACCAHDDKKDEMAKDEKVCCAECPDKGCEGCDCSKPENTEGCCMGGGCACGNGR